MEQHSTEVCGVERGRLPQGQKRNCDSEKFWWARNFTGEVFWARGYFVSTVGLDEAMVRAYIRNQEDQDERYDQMKLGV